MDWYSIVKFLHVVSAVVWVGGGFMLMLLAVLADRAGDVDASVKMMRATGELGGKLMMPASMLTLAFGLVMCWFWVGFSDLWIIIGLAGFAATAMIGTFVFKPTADRLGAMIAKDGVTPAVLAEGRRIMKIARFDYAVMLVVVADMVLKPTMADTVILTVMALVLAIGAAAAFGNFGDKAEAEA